MERGYADRITLSHDSACTIDIASEGAFGANPDWRLTHIPQDVLPMLRERGVSEDAIEQITVRNPRALFEANQPY